MHLNLPADFESLAEYRMLCAALRRVRVINQPLGDALVLMVATRLLLRLYVDLAYLARSNNRPGYLTAEGAVLYRASVGELFGDDCDPVALLVEARELELVPDRPGEWLCPRFARDNAHCSGDYVSKETRAANSSAVVRQARQVAREASQQAMLLPEELFQRADGTRMDAAEIQRSLILVRTLDNCLKQPARRKQDYTAGLMADACAVVQRYSATPEMLREFYAWLRNHRTHASVPPSAEQILREFDVIYAKSLTKH